MTIWFTSDHHFGHANIIKYCERPFNSVGHMNASMIGSWNGVVASDDTVYYLGDFAMQPHLVAEILPQLNGKKLLIAGNHDRCHPKIGSPSKWLHAYIDAGFDSRNPGNFCAARAGKARRARIPQRTEHN